MADAVIVNIETGEEEARPLTAAEQSQRDKDAAAALAQAEADAARPSVQQQLDDLRGRLDKAAAATVTGDAAKVRDALRPTQ